MARHQNITRMDYARAHGWWVRIYRNCAGKQKNCLSQLFSDGVYGGKRKALVAAIAWRDQMLELLPAKKQSGALRPPGYGYVVRYQGSNRWTAWLRTEGRGVKSTRYSIARWGADGAYDKAAAWLKREQRAVRARLRAG
jgi:hypothetical protein